uniref:Putative secreted protein n=1 Tax=Ixodes ricinus TaxID=34613 RepID=A0A6B0UZV1_IXORI
MRSVSCWLFVVQVLAPCWLGMVVQCLNTNLPEPLPPDLPKSAAEGSPAPPGERESSLVSWKASMVALATFSSQALTSGGEAHCLYMSCSSSQDTRRLHWSRPSRIWVTTCFWLHDSSEPPEKPSPHTLREGRPLPFGWQIICSSVSACLWESMGSRRRSEEQSTSGSLRQRSWIHCWLQI